MPFVFDADSPDFDLVCIGFGPAALAIAVAIHDLNLSHRVLFLEKQKQFAWHAGMLIPGAKMQISFLKDLATFRDPRSHFTFLNYLKEQDRLEAFTNLGTFLPSRQEFNDYLTWAASHFGHQVHYSTSAESVEALHGSDDKIIGWRIHADQGEHKKQYTARNLIIAIGGVPRLPSFLQDISPKIIHSSQYLFSVPSLIPTTKLESELHLVLVGAGQSAAETFHDLTTRYPSSKISLYVSDTALKPSDDSPFVNEIFNPSQISPIYNLSPEARAALTLSNRATNYAVVRPALLETLYEAQYAQRLAYGNEASAWRHRIVPSKRLVQAKAKAKAITNTNPKTKDRSKDELELLFADPLTGTHHTLPAIDLLVCGTGYTHTGHEPLLHGIKHHLATVNANANADPNATLSSGKWDVGRAYNLRFKPGVLERGCGGIWLQGLCEESHGISDSLLSVLAVRAGEVLADVFGAGSGAGTNGSLAERAKGNGNGAAAASSSSSSSSSSTSSSSSFSSSSSSPAKGLELANGTATGSTHGEVNGNAG